MHPKPVAQRLRHGQSSVEYLLLFIFMGVSLIFIVAFFSEALTDRLCRVLVDLDPAQAGAERCRGVAPGYYLLGPISTNCRIDIYTFEPIRLRVLDASPPDQPDVADDSPETAPPVIDLSADDADAPPVDPDAPIIAPLIEVMLPNPGEFTYALPKCRGIVVVGQPIQTLQFADGTTTVAPVAGAGFVELPGR